MHVKNNENYWQKFLNNLDLKLSFEASTLGVQGARLIAILL